MIRGACESRLSLLLLSDDVRRTRPVQAERRRPDVGARIPVFRLTLDWQVYRRFCRRSLQLAPSSDRRIVGNNESDRDRSHGTVLDHAFKNANRKQ